LQVQVDSPFGRQEEDMQVGVSAAVGVGLDDADGIPHPRVVHSSPALSGLSGLSDSSGRSVSSVADPPPDSDESDDPEESDGPSAPPDSSTSGSSPRS